MWGGRGGVTEGNGNDTARRLRRGRRWAILRVNQKTRGRCEAMTFGEKLKKARVEAGYTQEELAGILSVSRSAVAKWESGRGMPDVANLKTMAKLLHTSVDELLEDGAEMDLSVTKKAIDLEKYGDAGKLSRLKKIESKEKLLREEYPAAEIVRLTVTKIKNTRAEAAADGAIGWLALLLGGLPLFGTQEFGKTVNSLDRQYYLINEDGRQYFVLVTDEHLLSRAMAEPIRQKKFCVGDREFMTVGLVL